MFRNSIVLTALSVSLFACSGGRNQAPDAATPAVTSGAVANTGSQHPALASSPTATLTPRLDALAIRQKLAARRRVNLDRLLDYADAGIFPRNRVKPGMLNVFIDEDNHICAAANLIALDGHLDLVQATAANNNYVVLADVHRGPLYDWMLSSGFTQEEIAKIQEPYMMTVDMPTDIATEPGNHSFAVAPDPVEDPIAAEQRRVQEVLWRVHAELSDNNDAALDLSTRRLLAHPALAANFISSKQVASLK